MKVVDELEQALKGGLRCAIVRGAAGTGKTTLICELMSSLQDSQRNVILLAPTGRAAKILSQRTYSRASTIHAALYEAPNEPVTDQDGHWYWQYDIKKQSPVNAVIIVDEASMVGRDRACDDILRFGSGSLLADLAVWSGIRIKQSANALVFVGDPYQLPPFGERPGIPPALDEASLFELTGVRPRRFELSTVYRQSEESGILQEAMRIRSHLSTRYFGEFSLTSHEDVRLVSPEALESSYDPVTRLNNAPAISQCNTRRTTFASTSFLSNVGYYTIFRFWAQGGISHLMAFAA